MGYIRILIFSNNDLWERLYVLNDYIGTNDELKNKKDRMFCDGDCGANGFEVISHQDFLVQAEGDKISKFKRVKFNLVYNSLNFSYFIYVLQCSRIYRQYFIEHWSDRAGSYIPNSKSSTLRITLVEPPQQIIDYKWCHRIMDLVLERSELDTAMSWLSTLGGAYSALGDEFSHCARMAGRISLRQFQIALRLGDPSTVARCKLYIALSLIQTHKFKSAKHLIKAQYNLAISCACPDIRIIRMCCGIWSKLRYERSNYMKQNEKVTNSSF